MSGFGAAFHYTSRIELSASHRGVIRGGDFERDLFQEIHPLAFDRRLESCLHVEFLEYMPDVRFDGVKRDKASVGYLFVTVAGGDQLQHFDLSWRQVRIRIIDDLPFHQTRFSGYSAGLENCVQVGGFVA